MKVEKDHKEVVAKSIQVGAVTTSQKMDLPADRADGIDKARRVLRIIQAFLDNIDRR